MTTEYLLYFGVRVIVKRRFIYKGVNKIEVFNPINNSQFVINEDEAKTV
jgi:hypothetical protein